MVLRSRFAPPSGEVEPQHGDATPGERGADVGLPVSAYALAIALPPRQGDLRQRRARRAWHRLLRFDFTGLGGSEGDFATTNFSSNIGDLVARPIFCARTIRAAILVGHSLGGTAVLAAAPDIRNAPPWPRSARPSIPSTCCV